MVNTTMIVEKLMVIMVSIAVIRAEYKFFAILCPVSSIFGILFENLGTSVTSINVMMLTARMEHSPYIIGKNQKLSRNLEEALVVFILYLFSVIL
ncbi:hypothetical protein GCM10007111_15930 [Virgibacillus kapii]|uniref:Uncharacterized protein n=1 Tax=Virgibacillus kapii TaxID=1638645 RepID=A0ABQ2DDV5_9BACI|nr:hypothetical protein GCM10007111_15930 [Virgibacillus kapii]